MVGLAIRWVSFIAVTGLVVAAAAPRAFADAVGIVARSSADAPVPSPELAAAIADVLRGNGVEPESDPFARARQRVDRGAVPVERLAGFSKARNLAREGWRAYAAVESERAVQLLTEARTAALDVFDLDGGSALYADIALRLGVVQLQLGRAEVAADSFRLSRTLDPEREVSIASFAPDIVTAFDRAVAAQRDPVSIRVTSQPAGARIELDGRYVGSAPATIQTTRGAHVVIARSPGHRAQARAIAVTDSGRDVAIDLPSDPETQAIAVGSPGLTVGRASARTEVALSALIRYAELDGVVVVAGVWRRGQPALIGQYCADIPVRCTRIVEIRFPAPEAASSACAELWSALRAEARETTPALLEDRRLVAGEARPRQGPSESTGGCRWCRSPWLWVGVGAAVVAAGTTWLVLRDRDIEPVVTIDPCQFGGCETP